MAPQKRSHIHVFANICGTLWARMRRCPDFIVWLFHGLGFGRLSLWFTGTQEKLEPPEVLASHSRREEIGYERLSHRANAESQASVQTYPSG